MEVRVSREYNRITSPQVKDARMSSEFTLQTLLEESGDRENPGPEQIADLMTSVRTIAVVGISRNPEKPARSVPAYLAAKGYEIVPVNPFVDEILGKKALDSLDDVQDPVDMVLVFRPSEEAAIVADAALERPERPAIWLQKEIRADPVAIKARGQGITFVQDLCAYEVHSALNRT
jgi:predicted CoA-binding protein